MTSIRPANPEDTPEIWKILEPVIGAGETYTLPRDMTEKAAMEYWLAVGHHVFVAEAEGQIVGTYFLQANQKGGGAHVANCGYMTAVNQTGKGIARAMCQHSLDYAREQGFRAMQFNFVVSSNAIAVKLWESLGFQIVGRLPSVFHHPALGYVDTFVMHRFIAE